MSYSILIKSKENKIQEIPFSTNKNYMQLILPIATNLKLPLINDIQYGIDIKSDKEIIEFIEELNTIKKIIEKEDRHSYERIDFVIQELEDLLKKKEYESILIG